MPNTCFIVGCNTGLKGHPDEKLQTFSFPADAGLAKKWLKKVNREGFSVLGDLKPCHRICKKHFEADYFVPEEENVDERGRPYKLPKLKSLAVPTLHLRPVKVRFVAFYDFYKNISPGLFFLSNSIESSRVSEAIDTFRFAIFYIPFIQSSEIFHNFNKSCPIRTNEPILERMRHLESLYVHSLTSSEG